MKYATRLRYGFIFIFTPLPVIGFYLGGIFTLLTPFVGFVLVPLIDLLGWRDFENVPDSEYARVANQGYYRLLPMLFVPLQLTVLAWALWASSGVVTVWEWCALVLSVGVLTGGVGINISHELMHKRGKLERTLSKILLASVSYGHFYIEHVRGHHLRVATDDDPASARWGESFYRFYPRCVIGSFKSAWHLETKRLQRANLSFWSLRNNFWWILATPVLICAIVSLVLGWTAAAFFIVQGIIAFSLLEVTNYIEHYGLSRKKLANGRYEKVTYIHSWNVNSFMSNAFLFNLQRHSDHHAHPAKPYQVLRHLEVSPQLPVGYPGMIWLALCPPLWRKVMHPILEQRAETLEAAA